jgi:hypothetical protein
MRDPHDKKTAELPDVTQKRGRGRPPTGKAKTEAERAEAYRRRLAKDGGVRLTLNSDEFNTLQLALIHHGTDAAKGLLARLTSGGE